MNIEEKIKSLKANLYESKMTAKKYLLTRDMFILYGAKKKWRKEYHSYLLSIVGDIEKELLSLGVELEDY